MIEYQATINGLDRLQLHLEQAPALVLSETVSATNKALVTYQASARELAPIDTSRLRNSIAFTPAKVEGTTVSGSVNAGAPYAAAVEGGTGIYGPKKKLIKARPGKVLYWVNKDGEDVYAKSSKGMKGRFYMKGSLEKHQKDTDAYFAQATENVARAISEGGA